MQMQYNQTQKIGKKNKLKPKLDRTRRRSRDQDNSQSRSPSGSLSKSPAPEEDKTTGNTSPLKGKSLKKHQIRNSMDMFNS